MLVIAWCKEGRSVSSSVVSTCIASLFTGKQTGTYRAGADKDCLLIAAGESSVFCVRVELCSHLPCLWLLSSTRVCEESGDEDAVSPPGLVRVCVLAAWQLLLSASQMPRHSCGEGCGGGLRADQCRQTGRVYPYTQPTLWCQTRHKGECVDTSIIFIYMDAFEYVLIWKGKWISGEQGSRMKSWREKKDVAKLPSSK